VHGVRGAFVRKSAARAEVHPGIGAQGFWGAESAEGRGAAEDCAPVEISSLRRGPLHPRPRNQRHWGRHSAMRRAALGCHPERAKRHTVACHAERAQRVEGSATSSRPPRTPRSVARMADGGAPLRGLRVNHVARQGPSARGVQIPRLRAARFARDDKEGGGARVARDHSGGARPPGAFRPSGALRSGRR